MVDHTANVEMAPEEAATRIKNMIESLTTSRHDERPFGQNIIDKDLAALGLAYTALKTGSEGGA